MENTNSLLRRAFELTLPVLTGYLFLGLGYGILIAKIGLPVWFATLSALLIYGGAIQYLSIQILLAPFAPLSAFLMALMVNVRHVFYGLSLFELYAGTGRAKPYLIFSTTDETFSLHMAAPPPQVSKKQWLTTVNLLDHAYWVIGCTAGAAIGGALPFNTQGIDFVMTALFIVIFANNWAEKPARPAALTGLAASAACLFIFGPDRFMLPAMALIVVLLLLQRPKTQTSKTDGDKPGARS